MIFQLAQLLLLRHATVRSLRTLDALQLATVLGLHAVARLDSFLCADTNLCATAASEGLLVVNPEVP